MPAGDDDWRLTGQESYLMDAMLTWQSWSAPLGWDHDHCAFCWAKFMAADYPPEQREWREQHPEVLTVGYTIDGSQKSRHWICPKCFEDFRKRFRWTVVLPD
ncbi:MAG TPA: hypothetical protein VNS60_13645 [Solirubrobacterales bacterium]|nr:hypothetical protein [Solirubrobacterales bacterium]